MKINKIYNEDCLETMSKMPIDFCDIVITSPPYNYKLYTYLYNKHK
jgi:DNA modification methylase